MNSEKLVVGSNIGSAPPTAVDRALQEVGMNVHPDEIRTKRTFARARPETTSVKTINLALQGGSAHGAFTSGVLDRLLDEPRIAIGSARPAPAR
jgi:hypothetical protein